jgi:hypothetical protein
MIILYGSIRILNEESGRKMALHEEQQWMRNRGRGFSVKFL